MYRLQRWGNLSKLVTDTFVNFGNSLNSIILSPLSPQQKISWKRLFGRNGLFPSTRRIMTQTWGRPLLGGMIKNEQIQFFDSQMYCNNLNTITLKLFHNHGGIYRFRKKFKKDSGKINPLRVHRNMRVCILEINCEGLGWSSTVCLPFC